MRSDKVRQAINVMVFLVTVAMNGLANALPLNGQTTGEISDRFDVYFVPANYVFGIWGLIYLGLAAFVIFQALPSQRENPRLRRVGYLFALSSVANSAWLIFWHYEQYALTLIMMVTLLLTLIAIYLRLDIGRAEVPSRERWLVHLPFSIYLGWITVATIANVTTLLAYWNWGGWGLSEVAWTVIMLGAAILIGSAMALSRGDIAYLLVLAWAFAGIAIKHGDTATVANAAWIAAGAAAVLALFSLVRRTPPRPATAPAL